MTDDAASLVSLMPFAEELGIELTAVDPAEVRGTLPWAPERCTVAGVLHGGVLMALADSLGAVCAHLNLPPGASTSTISSTSNFFRAVRGGLAHGSTTPVHVGRSTIVVRTEVRDDEERLVSLTTQTQAVIS